MTKAEAIERVKSLEAEVKEAKENYNYWFGLVDDMEQNDDIHRSDTMEEKLSLANRFGVTIGYYKPDRRLYHDIVRTLADRHGIEMEDEKLFLLSDQWEMSHGGVSGRTAGQFINHLLADK